MCWKRWTESWTTTGSSSSRKLRLLLKLILTSCCLLLRILQVGGVILHCFCNELPCYVMFMFSHYPTWLSLLSLFDLFLKLHLFFRKLWWQEDSIKSVQEQIYRTSLRGLTAARDKNYHRRAVSAPSILQQEDHVSNGKTPGLMFSIIDVGVGRVQLDCNLALTN